MAESQAESQEVSHRLAPIALFVFLSGAAGLIYETVWLRMLIRTFGITLHATSAVIAVFMGGLALGSALFGRLSSKKKLSFKTYGWIEIAIGAAALASSVGLKFLPRFYAGLDSVFPALFDKNLFQLFLRIVLSGILLAVPTTLMGSTLPVLSEALRRQSGSLTERVAFLYGLNTLGAVIGVFLTGYCLIGWIGEAATLALAVVLNLAAGIGFLFINPGGPRGAVSPKAGPASGDFQFAGVLFIAAVSGLCALALEILWTRLLILVLGTSVYAFSAMLAVYLTGIAVGSLAVRRILPKISTPYRFLAWLFMASGVLSAASLQIYRSIGLSASSLRYLYSPLNSFADIKALFSTAVWVIAPVTLVFGMTFPLLTSIGKNEGGDGEAIGKIYLWNTIGGIVGSLVTGFWLVPLLGTQVAFASMAFILFVLGLGILLVRQPLQHRKELAFALVAGILMLQVLPSDANIYLSIIHKRLIQRFPGNVLFHEEEAAATLTGFGEGESKMLLVNGIITSGKGIPGQLMAHLPLLLNENPVDALVVCFGCGNTFRAAMDHVARVDTVDLIKGIPASNKYFYEDADRYLKDPRARVYVDDGRHYMLTTDRSYDVIIVDASPPIFSDGTVNLYSREFIELCRKRLKKDGIFCLWVPTPCFETDFWMIAKGFSETFPHLFVWGHPQMAGVFLMGSEKEFNYDERVLEKRIVERKLQRVAPWLNETVLRSGILLTEEEVKTAAANWPAVTDDRPYTEYPLPRFIRKETFWTSPRFLLDAKRGPVTPAAAR